MGKRTKKLEGTFYQHRHQPRNRNCQFDSHREGDAGVPESISATSGAAGVAVLMLPYPAWVTLTAYLNLAIALHTP